MTRSIAIAVEDLELDAVTVVAPAPVAYDVAKNVRVVPAGEVAKAPELVRAAIRSRSVRRRRRSR